MTLKEAFNKRVDFLKEHLKFDNNILSSYVTLNYTDFIIQTGNRVMSYRVYGHREDMGDFAIYKLN